MMLFLSLENEKTPKIRGFYYIISKKINGLHNFRNHYYAIQQRRACEFLPQPHKAAAA